MGSPWARSLAALVAARLAAPAIPCCAVGGAGTYRFQGQKNVIIWDEAAGVQHFIRDASFEASGTRFSFLAPTPSLPDIVEVDRQLFSYAADIQNSAHPPPPMPPAGGRMAGSRGYEVLQTKKVAGFIATTFAASDSKKTAEWLAREGYPAPDWLAGWLEAYIAKGWFITAFQVDGSSGRSSTGPIRMSFATDRPFNPYFVAKENLGASANPGLHLHFISSSAMKADTPWLAGQATRLREEEHKNILRMARLPESSLPAAMVMTSWQDPAFPKPLAPDLFFVADPEAKPSLIRSYAVAPPKEEGGIPYLPLALGLALGGSLWGGFWAAKKVRRRP